MNRFGEKRVKEIPEKSHMGQLAKQLSEMSGCKFRVYLIQSYAPRGWCNVSYVMEWNGEEHNFIMRVKSHEYVKKFLAAIIDLHYAGLLPKVPKKLEDLIVPSWYLIFSNQEGGEMPLSCDCFSGCWAFHSKEWPKLVFQDPEILKEAWRRCHQEEEMGKNMDRSDPRRIPYGSYVSTPGELRFETEELRNQWITQYGSLPQFIGRYKSAQG